RPAAEAFEGEAEILERREPLLELFRLARSELERLGEEELLRWQRARPQVTLQALEQDTLVRHVLVDEEDLVLTRRDDESVLELADDGPEARRGEDRVVLAEEPRLSAGSRPIGKRRDAFRNRHGVASDRQPTLTLDDPR